MQTFVVHEILKINSNDKYYHYNRAKKRNWGGVSVQVRSLIKCLSFNVSCSDRPSFINNQNFIIMHETKDNCATCAQKPITAESIVKEIISLDDPQNIREDLHEMMLAFFMFYGNPSEEFKGRIYQSYTTLYNALKKMETLNPRRAKS